MNLPFSIAFDLETTGLEPGSRIVQIGAVVVNDPSATFFVEVDPRMPIPADVAELHQRTDQEVIDIKQAIEDFATFVQVETLKRNGMLPLMVAHNLAFDSCHLLYAMDALGHESVLRQLRGICTLTISKHRHPGMKHNLDAMREHYDLQSRQRHNALGDAQITADLFAALVSAEGDHPPPAKICDMPSDRFVEWPKDIVMRDLPKLIKSAEPISFSYVDAKGRETERSIVPHGYYRHAESGELYFHGMCQLRNERRTFMLSRVANQA